MGCSKSHSRLQVRQQPPTVAFAFSKRSKHPQPAAAPQVEHGITELVNGGVDLVEWMLRLQVAGMEPLDLASITTERSGHSIEVRCVCRGAGRAVDRGRGGEGF